jgi:enediyne biosynthesis protein E4
VLGIFVVAQYPTLSPTEKGKLAAHFHFEKMPLPEVSGHPSIYKVREVHPKLQRIAAYISADGAAATLADLDGDGLPNDLIYIDPRANVVVVTPVPGTGDRYQPFVLTPGPLPFDAATTAPMGALAGDFNEDGLMDVLVYYVGRTPILFLRKKDDGTSVTLSRDSYVATELTTTGERWFSSCAVQADLDGDGHVDLLIGNYFQDGARILDAKADDVVEMHEGKGKALNGGYKHVFLWQSAKSGAVPSVTYREVKGVFSEAVARGWTLAIGVADLDGDLLPEIYLANDFGPDRLLHNRSTPGNLQFVELEGRRSFTTPKSSVLGHDSFKGMGVDFGDINGDGLLDIYVSNLATKMGLTESHFLWQSTGRLDDMKHGIAPYFQNSEKLGLSRSGFAWDSRLVDFDNDGVLEAIQAVGFIKGEVNRWPEAQALGMSNTKIIRDPSLWPSFKPGADLSGHELNAFFVRASDGRYYDVGREVGFTEPMNTRGIAVADVDGDGREDFVFANQWEPSFFYHNLSPHAGEFLGLHLLLPLNSARIPALIARAGHPGRDTPGRPAFGAEATVRLPNGRLLVGQVDGGSGHSGRRSPDIHLGLGQIPKDRPMTVELNWRNTAGKPQQATLQLLPGWHTVLLGSPESLTAGLDQ